MRRYYLQSGLCMSVLTVLILGGLYIAADLNATSPPSNGGTDNQIDDGVTSGTVFGQGTKIAGGVFAKGATTTVPCPDFDGDGVVGIPDFLQFVDHFGSSLGDGKYEAKYDLDGNDIIGIPDFLTFVDSFGKEVDCSGPDLIVESPLVSDNTLTTGQSFTLSATVRNQGTGSSAETALRYYQSSDATISTSDTEVGTDSVSGLSASGTSAESISLNAPSSAGTYYYGACVESVSGESDTNNNCSDGVSVTVSALTLPPGTLIMAPGETREYSKTFSDNFSFFGARIEYRVKSSTVDDGLSGLSDVEISYRSYQDIAYTTYVNSMTFRYNLHVSSTVPLNTTLRATIVYDVGTRVSPTFPLNVKKTYNVSLVILVRGSGSSGGGGSSPDLIVESPSVSDNTLTTGQSFTLSATVRNQGTGSSAATTLRYYRSSNATISTSDTEVGTDSVNGLSASGTSAESISLNAPSSAGTYYYGACVNSVTGESDTDNNCSDGVRVTVSSSSGGGGGGGGGVTFRDDFNSSGSLSDWEFFSARASVSGGVLRLTNTRSDRTARAVRSLGSVITEWEVKVRMGREKQTAGHNAAVALKTGDSRYSTIQFEVGSLRGFEEHTNYLLEVYDDHKSTWVTVSSGQSNAINEGAWQFTEIELQLKDGIMRAMAGDATLYEDNVLGTFPTAIERVELRASHPLLQTTGSTALFDWVKVSGTPTGGGGGGGSGSSLGACRAGLVVNPNESCTYKDDYTFSVSSSGTGNIIGGGLFMSAGNSINERGTINGVRWNFVASKNSGSNSWTIHTAD